MHPLGWGGSPLVKDRRLAQNLVVQKNVSYEGDGV